MKKFLFLICFLGIPFMSKALSIQNVSVANIDENNLSIKVVSYNTQSFFYENFNYSIDNQTITLNICYLYTPFDAIHTETNQFQIPVNTSLVLNYDLDVNIFFKNQISFICDYAQIENTANFMFSTPFSGEVVLSVLSEKFQQNLILYPNPSNGILDFDTSLINANVLIIDNLGRIVKSFSSKSINHLELFDLKNGVYFLKVTSDQGTVVNKIILKK